MESWEWGMDPLLTTDSLCWKRHKDSRIGTPRHCSICVRPAMCWMAVRAAANLDPHVAVSTVSCFFANHSTGVWFRQCSAPVTAQPVARSWQRLASLQVVVVTHLPFGMGTSGACRSLTSPQTDLDRSQSFVGRLEQSGSSTQIQMNAL